MAVLFVLWELLLLTLALATADVGDGATDLARLWLEEATLSVDALSAGLLRQVHLSDDGGRLERFQDFLKLLMGNETGAVTLRDAEERLREQVVASGRPSLSSWVIGASRSLEGMHGEASGVCTELAKMIASVREECGPPYHESRPELGVLRQECAFKEAISDDLVEWHCIMALDDWLYDLEAGGASSSRKDRLEWCYEYALSEDHRHIVRAIESCLPTIQKSRMLEHISEQRKMDTAIAAGKVLDSLGIAWFANLGGLLRLVRGGFHSFVDDDIDLGVFAEDLVPTNDPTRLERLAVAMRAEGFSHDGECHGRQLGECDRWGRFDPSGRLARIDWLLFHRGKQFNSCSVHITVYYTFEESIAYFEHWPNFCEHMRSGACQFRLRKFELELQTWMRPGNVGPPTSRAGFIRVPSPPEQYLEDLYGDWWIERNWSNLNSGCYHQKYAGLIFEPNEGSEALLIEQCPGTASFWRATDSLESLN